jgi:hypothetical protein
MPYQSICIFVPDSYRDCTLKIYSFISSSFDEKKWNSVIW